MTQLEKGVFLYRRSFSLLNLMHVKIWDYNACDGSLENVAPYIVVLCLAWSIV